MRIDYKILWVEDVKTWYEDSKGLIEDYLDDLGFVIESKHCKTFDDVKEEYALNQLKDYDILFVDFSLAGSPDGDEIIKFIRDQKDSPILTDVLFYSNDIESVRSSIRKYDFEGVYTSHRRDFIGKAEQVIETTVKKVQEVNTMRGLIMAETSELDHLMLEIITKYISKKEEGKSQELADYVFEKAEEFCNKNTLQFTGYKNNSDIIGLINSGLFHSMVKAKSIQKLVKLMGDKAFNDLKNFTQDYNKDVIVVRNNFAHVKEETDDKTGNKKLVSHIDGNDIEFTNESCIDIRKVLIQYSERLNELNRVIQV
jgi:hypothetical protein